jgi:hypothetical protein
MVVMTTQLIEFNGIQYSPITFEEFASHTKYSIFGVPRYKWSNESVIVLATFSSRNLSFTRKDFSRADKTMGQYAFLKPPSGGDAGPSISMGPAFDDAAWNKCKSQWESYRVSNGGAEFAPRFYFLGRILFDRSVFRSHYLELDTILFANSHAGDPVVPEPSSIAKGANQASPEEPALSTENAGEPVLRVKRMEQ